MNSIEEKPVQIQCPYTATSCPLFAGPVFNPDDVLAPPRQDERQYERGRHDVAPSSRQNDTRLPPISSLAHTSVSYQDYSLAPSAAPASHSEHYSIPRPRSPQRPISGGGCSAGASSCGSTPAAYTVPHTAPEQEVSSTGPSPAWDNPGEVRSRSVERDMEDLLGGGVFGTAYGGPGHPSYNGHVADTASNEDGSHDGSASPGADDEDRANDVVTPFISKLSHLLSHTDYTEFIRWNTAGDAFIFAHTSTALLDIFARFFRHSNVHSFVRQLNIYGFTRLSTLSLLSAIDSISYPHSSLSASDFSGFSHPLFWRERAGNPCDLTRIKPKVTKTKTASTAAKKDARKRKAANGDDPAGVRQAPTRRRTGA